jgi:hypothetical protein
MKYKILIILAIVLCFILAFGPAQELAKTNDSALLPAFSLIIIGILLLILVLIRDARIAKGLIGVLCLFLLPFVFVSTLGSSVLANETRSLYCSKTYGASGTGPLAEIDSVHEECGILYFSFDNASLSYTYEEINIFILNNCLILGVSVGTIVLLQLYRHKI